MFLTQLAEERLRGDSRRIRAKLLLTRQDLPTDPDHLVRQRDDGDLAMAANLDVPEPRSEGGLVPFEIEERGLGTLNKELAHVRVSALADPAQCGLATGRGLAWDEAEPSGHVTPPRKHAPISHGGDDGRRDQRTDPWHSQDATTHR